MSVQCDPVGPEIGTEMNKFSIIEVKIEPEISNENQLKCHLCNFKAERQNKLLEHLNSIHLISRFFPCDYPMCHFASKTKGNLKLHKSTVHSDKRPFKCNFSNCDFAAKRRWILKNHLTTHSNYRPFNCNLCKYSSKTPQDLKKHQKIKHKPKQATLLDTDTPYPRDVIVKIEHDQNEYQWPTPF